MAKLQEQSIVSPGEGDSTDDVTYLDVLSTVRLSNSACHTILSKLLASILRHESSESLRRRYRNHPCEVTLVLFIFKQVDYVSSNQKPEGVFYWRRVVWFAGWLILKGLLFYEVSGNMLHFSATFITAKVWWTEICPSLSCELSWLKVVTVRRIWKSKR